MGNYPKLLRLANWRIGSRACLYAFAIATIATLIIILQSCSWIVGGAANTVYPSLASPEETEAPPTFTTYYPSAATEAIFGGRGVGLDCSIPKPLKAFAFKTDAGGAPISLQFRQSCIMHDLCYRHGYATYGYTQAQCDVMLQESAYRLCRQINKSTREETRSSVAAAYTECETEARKVLLGVTLGGGGSFKSKGRSTYFEYDPMPTHADDYVVGRAVDDATARATVGDLGIRTFHILRQTMSMRKLINDRASSTGEKQTTTPRLFPDQRIATPPQLTGYPDAGSRVAVASLVSIARKDLKSTDLKLYELQTLAPSQSGTGAYELQFKACPDRHNSPCSTDVDAPIHKFVTVDHKPLLLSVTHRGSIPETDSNPCPSGHNVLGSTVKVVQKSVMFDETQPLESPQIVCKDGKKTPAWPMDDYPLNAKTLMRQKYRFMQHDVLIEKNAANQATHAWVLGRGAKLSTRTAGHEPLFEEDSAGSTYQTHVVVARQALGNRKFTEIDRFELEASETDEPFQLVRLGGSRGVALMSLGWQAADRARVSDDQTPWAPPILKLWRVPGKDRDASQQPMTVSLPEALRDRYTDIPPVVARLSTREEPILIFAKLSPPPTLNQEEEAAALDFKDTTAASSIVMDLVVISLMPEADTRIRPLIVQQLSCKIDLWKQMNNAKASILKTRAYGAEGISPPAKAEPPLKENSHATARGMTDLANRWRMSQLIASERSSSDSSRALELTMVFNGFPSMSVQVRFKTYDGKIEGGQPATLNDYFSCAPPSIVAKT